MNSVHAASVSSERERMSGFLVDYQPALATDDGVRAVYAAHGPELYRFAVRSLGDRGLAGPPPRKMVYWYST